MPHIATSFASRSTHLYSKNNFRELGVKGPGQNNYLLANLTP